MKKILYLASLLLIITACAQTEKAVLDTDIPIADREKAQKYAETVSIDTKYLTETEAFAFREAAYFPNRQKQQEYQPLPNGRPHPLKIYSELYLYEIKSVPCLQLDEEAFLVNPTPDNLLRNLKLSQTNMMFSLKHKDSISEYQLWNIEKSARDERWGSRVSYQVEEHRPEYVKETGYSIFLFYANLYIAVFDQTGQATLYNLLYEKEDLEELSGYIVRKLEMIKKKNPDGTFGSFGR